MAEKKYLDYTGFSYFVEKIKALLTNKADKTLSNVDSSVLAEKVSESGAGGTPIVTTAGDGAAYTATVPNVTALSVGLTVTIIPHTVSTSTTPTLNVNSLGAKQIRRRLSNMATSQEPGYSASWLASGKPFTVKYDGTYWIVEDMTKPTAADLYGTLPISKGGTGAATAAAALEALGAAAKVHTHETGDITGLETILSGAAKVQTGSYTGTGTYGSSNPCSLTFDFVPRWFGIIMQKSNTQSFSTVNMWWVSGVEQTSCTWTLSGTTLSWYGTEVSDQRNIKNYTYWYVAIG